MTKYYEIHCIVKAGKHKHPEWAKQRSIEEAKEVGYWYSEIEHDHGNEEDAGDLIFTNRAQTPSLARVKVEEFFRAVRPLGVTISRYKVETVEVDSKAEDVWKLL